MITEQQREAEAATAPEPGIHRNIPAATYHSWQLMSSHRLATLERSPRHYIAELERPRTQTPAMARGQAVHMAVYEPELFKQTYAVSPKFDRRTKEGKAGAEAFAAVNAGKTVIDADEWAQYTAMSKSVWAHLAAGKILKGKIDTEISGVFDDPTTMIRCKCRADWINHDIGAVCDLKTCENASLDEFESSIGKFNYYRQAAFYLDGFAALGLAFKRFILIAVESEYPYAVAVYRLDEEAIEAGRKINRALMQVAKRCMDSGEWPAYSPAVQDIGIPAWLWKRIENTYL